MINNTAPGLVSTNPFLNQKAIAPTTGGATTSFTAPTDTTAKSTGAGLVNTAAALFGGPPTTINGTMRTQPVPTSVSFGSIPTGINGTLNNGVLPSSNKTSDQGLLNAATPVTQNNSTGTNPLYATPGQTYAQYEASQGFPQNTVSASTPTPGYSTSNPPTFPGLVSTLANTSSQPTPAFSASQGTAQTAATDLLNSTPGNNAAVLAQQQSIQKLQDEYAKESADISGTPGDLSLANGEQGTLYNRYSGQLGAQETGLQNILQGNAQQQAAYTGAASAANTTASGATSQQGTQQSGLGAAAGLAQPSYLAPGQQPYSPTTNQYGAPADSSATGVNPQTLQSIGAINGQIGVGQNVTQLNSALGGAQVVGNNLNQLIQSAGINPSGLSVVNGALQFGANQLGNPQYQEFQGQINDFINSIAPILGGASGNSTDYKTQLASQVVNALASGQNIQQVVSYFLNQAQQKIQGISSGGGAGVGSTNTNGNSTTGGSTFGSFF